MRFVAIASATLIHAAAAATPPAGDAIALAAARLPTTSLIVLPAGCSATSRWVAWATSGSRPSSRLALVDRGVVLGSIVHDDAYDPLLRAVPQWTRNGIAVLAFTVSFGAGAEQVELVATEGGKPRVVASQLGAAIGWTVATTGSPVLVVYSRTGSALQPHCRTYDERAGLTEMPCPPEGVPANR